MVDNTIITCVVFLHSCKHIGVQDKLWSCLDYLPPVLTSSTVGFLTNRRIATKAGCSMDDKPTAAIASTLADSVYIWSRGVHVCTRAQSLHQHKHLAVTPSRALETHAIP